jgi:hypothetical protein
MGCLSSGNLKEEKTKFALLNTICRILVLSSRKCPRLRCCWLVCIPRLRAADVSAFSEARPW